MLTYVAMLTYADSSKQDGTRVVSGGARVVSGGVEALAQLPHNRLQALHELISQEQAGEGMSVYSS